jgi:hypothetical protein
MLRAKASGKIYKKLPPVTFAMSVIIGACEPLCKPLIKMRPNKAYKELLGMKIDQIRKIMEDENKIESIIKET